MKFMILILLLIFKPIPIFGADLTSQNDKTKSSEQQFTQLFNEIELIPPARLSPLPWDNRSYFIDINFDELKFSPDRLQINLDINEVILINKSSFIARDGFIIKDGKTLPNPSLTNSELSYMWSGLSDDFDVVLTIHNGEINGIVTGNNRRFVINNNSMTHLRLSGIIAPNNFKTDVVIPLKINPVTNKEDTFLSHLKTINNNLPNTLDVNEIEVLILWTEKSRAYNSGLDDDPNDTQGLDTLIQASIDNANTTFINSRSNTRIAGYFSAKINNFDDSGSHSENLLKLQSNAAVKEMRNAIGADVVSLMVANYNFKSPNCGAAFSQTIENKFYNDPMGFDDFAFTIFETLCAVWYNSFSHELGHLLGANHARDEMDDDLINNIINNGFADAFAWNSNEFNTTMSINPSVFSRRLYFSNPILKIEGMPIGDLNTSNNTGVIDVISQEVAQYRTGPDLLFKAGFELD